jgi:hypothetical protein
MLIVCRLAGLSALIEREPNEKGERLVWTEDIWANMLDAMRHPGVSWSDVILRLAAAECG